MTLHPATALIALVCGLLAGLALNRLIKRRPAAARAFRDDPAAAERVRRHGLPPSWRRVDRSAVRARPPGGRRLLVLNLVVLAGGSLLLAALPGLGSAFMLSQGLLLFYLLYALALVDALTLTVEPLVVLGGIVLRLAAVLIAAPGQGAAMAGGLLAGAGLLYLVAFFYRELRGREGLGQGDPAVLGLVGAFVGWRGLLPVVLLATLAGVAAGLPALAALRRPLSTPLPFAPFLCAAGLLVFLARAHGWSLFGLLPGG